MSPTVLKEELTDLHEVVMLYSPTEAERTITERSAVQTKLWKIFNLEEIQQKLSLHWRARRTSSKRIRLRSTYWTVRDRRREGGRSSYFFRTSNFDIRSFALDFEVNLVFYRQEETEKLRAQQQSYIDQSEFVRSETWQARSSATKIAENIAKLFSPLL